MESVKRYGLYTMKDKISEVGPVAESRIIGLRAGFEYTKIPLLKQFCYFQKASVVRNVITLQTVRRNETLDLFNSN